MKRILPLLAALLFAACGSNTSTTVVKDVAMCPPGVKHWHGAAPGSRFAHLAANTNPDKPGVEWFDLLPEEEYNKLPKE